MQIRREGLDAALRKQKIMVFMPATGRIQEATTLEEQGLRGFIRQLHGHPSFLPEGRRWNVRPGSE